MKVQSFGRSEEQSAGKKQIPPPQAAEDRSLRVGMTVFAGP
jgi:hypothetical protein